jgi:hypothetical protein
MSPRTVSGVAAQSRLALSAIPGRRLGKRACEAGKDMIGPAPAGLSHTLRGLHTGLGVKMTTPDFSLFRRRLL